MPSLPRTYSEHMATAREWMAFMQSERIQRKELTELSHAPVLASLYDDPKLQKQAPYLSTLKQSILQAESRPVTPNYNEVTLAMQKNGYAALQGDKSVDAALADMSEELERAAARH